MDIVLPLAHRKSKANDDFEIRYCLRSIEKFVKPERIFIIGYKPDWMQEVKHLSCSDPYVIKDCNIINKVLYACFNGVHDSFIRVSDDQYFLKPYEPKIYSSGYIKDKSNEGWHRTAFNTWDVLTSKKLPTLNYDTHTPQLIFRNQYVETILNSSWAQGDGLLANSYYFNAMDWIARPFSPKIARYKTAQQSYDFGDADFLNHNDTGLTPLLKKKIMELFPDKCEYEK